MKSFFCLCVSVVLSSSLLFGCGGPSTETGTLQIEASLEQDPPKTGKNVLMITVKDKAGSPVEKATVTVDPQMPSMGHGSSEAAKVEEVGQGKYKASPVTFQMGGEWEVTVNAKKGDDTGKKTFKYNVK